MGVKSIQVRSLVDSIRVKLKKLNFEMSPYRSAVLGNSLQWQSDVLPPL